MFQTLSEPMMSCLFHHFICTDEEFFPERCSQINNLDPEMERDIRVSFQTFVMEMKQHRGKSGLDLVVASAVEKVVT